MKRIMALISEKERVSKADESINSEGFFLLDDTGRGIILYNDVTKLDPL